MGRMGVRRETVNKKAARLSSGERAKVILAGIILGNNNLLVLDEPTNYLDIETQDVLLEALADFPGAILFVSHDRYFVEELATETLTLGPIRNPREGTFTRLKGVGSREWGVGKSRFYRLCGRWDAEVSYGFL